MKVPQTGLFSFDRGELVAKPDGSEVIFVTHQPDKSWLNAVVSLNISSILVTLEVSQSLCLD